MLDAEEILELEDKIREVNWTEILTRLNRSEQLENFLDYVGLKHLLGEEPRYEVFKNGKIIVIGQSDVKGEVLLSIAKNLGIEKGRLELYLEYEDAKKFDFRKIRWQPKYSLVMVGPMPHSGSGKGAYSSMIASLESESGYPPVVRLGSNGLKITKSDFRKRLQEELSAQIIVA